MSNEQQQNAINSTDTSAFEFNANPIKVSFTVFPNTKRAFQVTHVLSKPTFEQEEARERAMPLISSDMGKVEGADASSMSLDDEPANVKLYDKIAQRVIGYPLQRGETPAEDGVEPNAVIATPEGEKTVLEMIPTGHKSAAINGMFPSNFELDEDDDNFAFALGGGREWEIVQKIGGQIKQSDGTFSSPQFVIKYIFKEPMEGQRKKFRSSAINALTLKTRDGAKERRSANLRVISELFDTLIEKVEGGTVDGQEVNVRDKNHLKAIPAAFKRGSLVRMFAALEVDLGN